MELISNLAKMRRKSQQAEGTSAVINTNILVLSILNFGYKH